jgi:hypothetical protein
MERKLMSSIRLHSRLGVNPRLTICRRCGGTGEELILLGDKNYVDTCSCGLHVYGGISGISPCPKCKATGGVKRRTLEDNERLPSGSLCRDCEKEAKEFAKIVADGGIYFKCEECKREGVIKPESGCSISVRKKLNFAAPDPCGIEFQKCEQHTPGHPDKPDE